MMIKDHESSAVGHAITLFARHLAERLPRGTETRLRLCYLLPGEDGELPLQGMQISTHDLDRGILTILASIPAHMVHDTQLAGRYVHALAADAVDAAQDFFLEQGITTFDVDTLQACILTIRPADLRPPNQEQVKNTDFDLS